MKLATALRQWGSAPRWRDRLPVALPLALYLILTLAGITNSNIGVAPLRQDPAKPYGIQIGSAQAVRSDEFMTESTITLGQIAVGAGDPVNPLSVSPNFFSQLPSGPVSAVVFFDGSLMRLGPWLPDSMLFAAKWWLPTLLLGIGMPIWFRQVTGRLRWGYLAAILTVVAPASVWWSGRPVNTLGFMFAACALGIYAADRLARDDRTRFVLAIVAAGVLLARFPTYYQPMAIVLGFPVVFATAGYLLVRPQPRRLKLLALGALASSGLVLTGLLMLEDLHAITTGLATVFPGQRRSTGTVNMVGRVFGGTELGSLRSTAQQLIATNATEVSTSFTVLLLVLAVLVPASRWRGGAPAAAAFLPMFVSGLFWLTWCTVSYGSLGLRLPLVNLVPSFRAANSVGFVAVIAFCLYMSQWRRPPSMAAPVAAGMLTAYVSAWAGSSLQLEVMPLLTTKTIWLSALLSGLVVFALVAWPRRLAPMAVAGLTAALMTYNAAPILVGLADLRDSPTARFFLTTGQSSRAQGALWASNSMYVDALMLATGTPALSARQQIGPNRAEWERLDPGGAHEQVWNRGGTYITFDWAATPGIQWSNPTPDVIVMRASPCTVASRIPELRYVVSDRPLTDPCLTEQRTIMWSGMQQRVYDVR